MSSMKRYWMAPFLLATLFLVSAYGSAQPAPYVLETYDLTRLDARPGQIVVSPDVLTLLEFDGQVGDVSTARPDAMTIEVSGNVIRLRANWTTGKRRRSGGGLKTSPHHSSPSRSIRAHTTARRMATPH